MRRRWQVAGCVFAVAAIATPRLASAQLPLGGVPTSGQPVYPVFEGWYRNPDGTYSISFGYFNRNSEEVLEIPVGPDNFVTPGEPNQGQPSHFEPRRHWGVFAIKVPADFRDGQVVWTIRVRGETIAIPGSLHPNWQIDALEGEAGSGNTPPVLRFAPNSADGSGPAGTTAGPLTVKARAPLVVAVWARDDGKSATNVAGVRRSAALLTLTWFKHQGPGSVTFSEAAPTLSADGKATTTMTFSAPGDYLLRVRANDASGVASAGHAQCCWTNGFVKVTVTP